MENIDYKRNRHSCYSLKYHLVVVTKRCCPILTESVKDRLLELVGGLIGEQWKCRIVHVDTGYDYLHIRFEAPPQVQLSKLANNLKTVTSRLLRKEFSEELLQYYQKSYFWADSYFVCTESEYADAIVSKYIEDQRKAAGTA